LYKYVVKIKPNTDSKVIKRIRRNIIRAFARALLCLGCGLCELACPTGAIRIEKRESKKFEVIIDSEKCTGCLICNDLCPVGVFYEIAIKD